MENFHLTKKLLSDTTNTPDDWKVPSHILTQVAEAYTILNNEIETFQLIKQLFENITFTSDIHEEDFGLYGCTSAFPNYALIATPSTWMKKNTNR